MSQQSQTEPFPINPEIVIVNAAIDGVFGVAVKAAEAALVAVDPAVFGLPVLEQIDNKIIEFIAGEIYKRFSSWVSFEIIDFKDAAQVTEQQKALVALKAAQQSGDPNALTKALKDFDKTTAALTHMDGTSA